jgi:pimeloyl-ACP methyl ester carboxylesterase
MTHTLLTSSVRTTDGLTLHMEGTGRPTALMVHGLGYASWEAHPLRNALDDEFGLWSLDNRGTGKSEAGGDDCSIERLAEDAALAIAGLGGPLIVIGHSMGGYIAQTLAMSHPQLVRSLVLIATSPGGPASEPVPNATTRTWSDAVGLSPAEYARRTMPLSFRPGWCEEHPLAFEGLLAERLAYPTSGKVWQQQFRAAQKFLAKGAAVKDLEVPSMVLHGTDDRVVPVSNGRLLSREIPAAQYHEIAGAGHLIHLEQPMLVAQLIKTFADHHSRGEGNHHAQH